MSKRTWFLGRQGLLVLGCLALVAFIIAFIKTDEARQKEQPVQNKVENKYIRQMSCYRNISVQALAELKKLEKYDYLGQTKQAISLHEASFNAPGADYKTVCRDILLDLQKFASLAYGKLHNDDTGTIWSRTQELIREFHRTERDWQA